MASSHILSYKSTNRIDPKLKRRLRRSEESSAKREEEINRRRNLVLMSPCQELNIDLSMNSSSISLDSPISKNVALKSETTVAKPPTAKLQNKKQLETKAKEKNTKSSQAHCERLNMLRKWKEERELLKKEEALKRGKNKPFIVSVTSHASSDIKTNFERKWEQEQKKKTAKKPVAVSAAPATRQRAGTTSSKSTLTTTATSQRTTRQTANKQTKPSAAVSSTRAVTTRAAPATQASKPLAPTSMRAISTRAASSKTMNSQPVPPKKAPPKTTRTEPVRRSTRHSVKTLPDVPSVKTRRGQKQKMEAEQPVIFETHLEDEKEEELVVEPKVENLDISTKKVVSFAPANFVFTAPDLQSLEISSFSRSTLSPASTHSFFYEDSRSSSSPETNNFVTTRAFFPREQPEMSSSTLETIPNGRDSGNGAVSSSKKAWKLSHSPPSHDILYESIPDEKQSDNSDVSSSKKARKTSNSPPSQGVPCEYVPDKKESDHSDSQKISDSPPSLDIPCETEQGKPVNEDDCTVEKSATADMSKDLSTVNNSPPKTTAPVFRTPVSQVPRTRRMRHSVSEKRANIDVSPMGKCRRRKTEMARTPQSPEEWVALLRNSPMIQMTRKKYSKEKLENSPLPLKFTDDDLIAANIIPTKETSFNQTAENLPEETSHLQMEICDKITPITESAPEKPPEVLSVELPPTESPVALLSEPEPIVAKTEDKKDERSTNFSSTIVKHDVAYFRNLIKSETDSLNSLAHTFETIIPSVSEEVEGQIRTVIGQTNLLISKRFRQFIGLIDNCEYNTGEKETTCEDLQGFWDMVDFQVEDVKTKFSDLSKSKANNWQPLETAPPPPLAVKKPVKKLIKKVNKPAPAKVTKSKGRSEFALFMAQKKKEAKALEEAKVATPPSKMEQDSHLKVFDGLFFKIESPVKSPKPHCEAEISGSPVVIPTFVETDRSVRLSPTITPIDMIENGEDLNMDSAKTVSPAKEPPQQEETKSPCSPASPLVTAKSFQRSFLPAIPSPLLQDITPHKKKRASRKSFLFTDAGSQKRTEVTPRQNSEMETDQEPTEKVLVLQTPPRRRSVRKSVTSAVNKTPSLDDMMQSFIKNLSSSSLNGSQPSENLILNSPVETSKELPDWTPLKNEKPTPRQTRRRKTVGSQPSENLIINSPVETSKELPDLTPLKNEKPTPRQTRRRKTVGSQPSENLIINSPVETSKELPDLTPLKNGKPTPRKTRRRKTVDSQASNPSPNRRCSTRISRQSVSISEEQQTTSLKENVSLLHPIVLHETSEIKSERGTRKTKCVAFSDEVSTVANTDSPLTVLSPVSLNVDTMEERKELNKNGQFKKLKVNYTPVRGLNPSPTTTLRRSRRSTYLMTFSP